MKKMKKTMLIAFITVFLFSIDGCGGNNEKNNSPFSISTGGIKKAIEFGKNSDCGVDEMGRYNFGLNRFDIGSDAGSIEIVTPFIAVAAAAKKSRKMKKDFNYDDAEKVANEPQYVYVLMHLTKEQKDGKFDCLLKTKKETIDLSDNVSTSSYWNEKTGETIKAFMYALPVENIVDESEFKLILKNDVIGEREFLIKSSKLK